MLGRMLAQCMAACLLNAGPSAERRAVCSMQGRSLNAGALRSIHGPSAQCIGRPVNVGAVRSMHGCSLNARPSAQGRPLHAGPDGRCSMQSGMLDAGPSTQCRTVSSMQGRQLQGRLLNAGPHARSMQGRMLAQCRAACSLNAGPSAQCRPMQGRLLNAGPHARSMQGRMLAQCRAACSLNAGPHARSNARPDACSMQGLMRAPCRDGCVLNARPDAPCRAGCHRRTVRSMSGPYLHASHSFVFSGQSAVANTANCRKDSKKETKSKDSAQVQKVVPIQPRSNHQSPPEVHAATQAKVQWL